MLVKGVGVAIILTLLLAGCTSNQAYDTLGTLQDRTGRTIFEDDFATDRSVEGPQGDATEFSVPDGAAGMVLRVDLFPDERLEVQVEDAEGTTLYRGVHGDDRFYDRTIVQPLDGAPGTWRLVWQANEDLFQDSHIEIMVKDGPSGITETTFREDRGHHFLRLTGSMAGWGGTADVRVIAPDGEVAWSGSVAGSARAFNERIDARPGTYHLEVDPGAWTGVIDLRVLGVFQGQG